MADIRASARGIDRHDEENRGTDSTRRGVIVIASTLRPAVPSAVAGGYMYVFSSTYAESPQLGCPSLR